MITGADESFYQELKLGESQRILKYSEQPQLVNLGQGHSRSSSHTHTSM